MVIMGIDPGTASMGYGVIKIDGERPVLKEHGVVRTGPSLSMPKRLGVLYSNLDDVAKKFKPQLIVIEKLFFNTNSKTAMSVGQARGISLLVAAHNNIEVVEYTALQAKKILSGYGRADKKEMQKAVRKILGISQVIKPDDANDGVAMALCHFRIDSGHKDED
jgi:crossover junction endodeoxyribonuclease RuvC